MASIVATDDSAASTAGMRDDDGSVSGESLPEWRPYEQVENESPSTSPPFWDTDGDDDDPGPKPSDLFGRYTWRIEKFSKEKKREMKSEPFEAGGYKWYILVYPRGCDVSNHLSLFLCVANHDKLLPGWSHFAQFTIAVGNVDPKKVKYSDTLHRFWKKEHDWGWKKFMELSKIQDGFLVDDVLEIIAQVQVIREKADRPFRCLDRPYRRELLCVYMTNIEQIYRRFVEERRSKLSKLIEDKMRWSSFQAFWLAIDPSTRHRMSREKTDAILRVMVKHFFVEKEVTSTLVMDSLYMGLKALEYQSRGKKGRTKVVDLEELPAPMVHVDMDMFVLAGDVIALLERAALEPLPCQPVSPKDDKCSQSRTKDGGSGEVNKISIERAERRLTELGQKILETFVLSHIFSGIEVAYQEAVALKRQEELIREEEAAGLLENEMKGKRGGVTEKEKRAKKKQAKQKKNNRKIKDKERNEKSDANIHEGLQDESAMDDSDGLPSKQAKQLTTKVDTLEEGASDVPSNLDGSVEECQPDSDDKNVRPINGVNDVGSEIKNSRRGTKISSVENNSSTCLAESSTMNIMQKGNNLPESKSQISPNRGKNQRNSGIISLRSAVENLRSSIAGGSDRNTSGCGTAPKLDQETLLLSLKDKIRRLEQRLHEKEIEGRKLLKAHFEVMGTTTKAAGSSSSSSSSSSSTSSSEEPPNVLKRLEQSSETTTNCREQSSQIADRLEQSLETTTDHPEQSLETTTNHPEQSSETTADATNYAPPTKAVPVATCSPNASVPVMPTSTMKTVPVNAPTTKVESVLSKEHISNLMLQTDRAPIPSKLSPFDKVAPLPSRSPQVDKAIPAPPRSPQVDKGASHSTELPQSSTSNSEAQEESTSTKVASVSQVVTATSRPSSAPLFPVPGSAVPSTPPIQAFPLLSRSMSEAGRLGNDPSPSAPTYVPQTYRNAIIGKPTLGTTSESLAYQPTSLGQGVALSQPLSTYTSTTSVMVPPARNDKFSGRQGFNFGLGKSEALDNWQQWKGDIDPIGNKHLWRDESPYQQTTNSNAYRHTWQDDLYQQASSSETEKLGRFGGLQPRLFRTEIPVNFALQQSQGPVAEEFPHIDIINDLLEEEQSNGNMPESLHHDYHAFGLPLSSRGNFADSEMASVSSSGRFNATERYYDDRFPRTYDSMSALHGLRDGQFSALDVYSNGRPDLIASKPWLYGSPNPSINLGINTNGFSHQLGDYTNLASRVNGDSLYRRANGHR